MVRTQHSAELKFSARCSENVAKDWYHTSNIAAKYNKQLFFSVIQQFLFKQCRFSCKKETPTTTSIFRQVPSCMNIQQGRHFLHGCSTFSTDAVKSSIYIFGGGTRTLARFAAFMDLINSPSGNWIGYFQSLSTASRIVERVATYQLQENRRICRFS